MNNTEFTQPSHCSDEEWSLRVRLAQCYHLVDWFGWTEAIFNHISARLPGPAHHYLVNPFGLNYTEVTPQNLLKVDLHGKKLEPSEYDGNPAGFALHSAVHGARDDIQCLIHTHTTPISAIAQKKAGFGHHDFYGAQLHGRVGYHTFEGITLFDDEKQRMIQSLGDKHILVLRNHGIAVGESSIEKALFLLWTVQRAAENQCAAGALGGEDNPLPEDISVKCADLTAMLIRESGFADKFFKAMVRKMSAERGLTW
ncbi:class II aldolase/adducin family protein [Pseudomonas chlororaphis]|uniref:class II aldolase/adducin family protein n=1 Tax=Pseudomonas chlororaphis TaxID=587753 RepID=UPI0003D31534|nr:class II aldolase/adducin family protein [Pseudomonas chlororaphis]AZD29821.1 Ribulose-5-phosphate 4-epimerase, putative [Pseudomonas chlororaphis]ETD39223.1 ribulose-5-phosphate 4-epimerase [Pseudomonas chlororaphis subsp. aurantiaca PB-St2]QFS55269.1 class II aldolase/adducin family protein [Pseudomonas chlororaphis subsp. aurantiaca]